MALTKHDLSGYKTTRTGTGRMWPSATHMKEYEVYLRYSASLCNAVSSVISVAVSSVTSVAVSSVTSGAITSVP
jgi:hypothetical protein